MVVYSNGIYIAGEEDNGRKSKNGNGNIYCDLTSFFVHTSPQQNLNTLKISYSTVYVLSINALQVITDPTSGLVADLACEVEITEYEFFSL